MKIDVIIPTFNRATLVERAIESVLKQTYKDFHLYVVDDGSTDETPAILEKYKTHPQITLFHQANKGVSAARNFGAKNSSSEWISFLDSDDEWLPNKLKAQTDYLSSHPECDFLHAEEIWIRNGVRVNPKQKHDKGPLNLFERSLEFCLISPSTVILKRTVFEEFNGFNEEMVVCEDFDLWNKILVNHTVGFLNFFVAQKYGGHEDQLSTKYVAMDYLRIKSLLALSEMAHLSPEQKEMVLNVVRKKTPQLLQGYLKHQNQEKYEELLAMTARL